MLFKPTFWLKSVLQIDEGFLRKNGVKALVLDHGQHTLHARKSGGGIRGGRVAGQNARPGNKNARGVQ